MTHDITVGKGANPLPFLNLDSNGRGQKNLSNTAAPRNLNTPEMPHLRTMAINVTHFQGGLQTTGSDNRARSKAAI